MKEAMEVVAGTVKAVYAGNSYGAGNGGGSCAGNSHGGGYGSGCGAGRSQQTACGDPSSALENQSGKEVIRSVSCRKFQGNEVPSFQLPSRIPLPSLHNIASCNVLRMEPRHNKVSQWLPYRPDNRPQLPPEYCLLAIESPGRDMRNYLRRQIDADSRCG